MPGNYVLLQTTELTASAASVTFSSIPQTGYTDLKIVASVRSNRTEVADNLKIWFNGSTTGFTNKNLYGTGTAAGASSDTGIYPNTNADASTASTFSNIEMYISNYTSNISKSAMIYAVTENSAALAYTNLMTGSWSNTAAITSVSIYPYSGTALLQYSTFSLYGLAALGTTPTTAPKASGGNSVSTDGTYWYHTFTSSGYFTPSAGLTCDYLVVAGGGGGGNNAGGGGGAGGLRSTVGATGGGGSLESALSLSAQAYIVTVGAGGPGGTDGGIYGVDGSSSVFATITSIGGGGGGGLGRSGGSGGGSGYYNGDAVIPGGSGTSGQGYAAGAYAYPGANTRSGGGGAGAVGSTGAAGGNGGNGVATSISGSSVSYAGGGGGGSTGAANSNSSGGTGGGGAGGANENLPPSTAGTANRGGGGGGGASQSISYSGAAGGSGIVIVRYAV